MTIADNLSVVYQIASQREKSNKCDTIVVKMRNKEERKKNLGVGIW
jgi:hypothetical protein